MTLSNNPGSTFEVLGFFEPKAMKTVMGEHICDAPDFKASLVIFVDLCPDANWAHECLYIFLDAQSNNYKMCKADWPPSETNVKLA